MIDGTDICLRTWEDKDIPMLTTMRNDLALQAQLLARARGSRPEQVQEWLQSRSTHPDRLLFIIANRKADQALGYIQISELNTIDGYAELGICLINEARGRGLAGQAITQISNYLRDQWRLRKLGLRVRDDNRAALKCYEKAGFERCGILRQHVFIDGHWQDVVLMERFLINSD